jgi:guanylate kinase
MRKVVILGKAATGKTFLTERMEASFHPFNIARYHTTRPKREGEVEGHEYYFIKSLFFWITRIFVRWVIKTKFNGWWYLLSEEEYYRSNVIVCSPEGFEQLKKEFGEPNLYSIYLVESRDERMSRLLKRGDVDSVTRRIEADEKDFLNIHREMDFICKSEQYGRVMGNAVTFLQTGKKCYSIFDYKVDVVS